MIKDTGGQAFPGMETIETQKYDISLIAPIRNQTNELKRLMESLKKTTADPRMVEIILIIDNCDAEMQALKNHYEERYESFSLKIISVKRSEHFVRDYYNFAALQATGRWILAINIDVVFLTECWDKRITKEMNEKASECKDDILYGVVHDGLPRKGDPAAEGSNKAIWPEKVDFSCWILTSNQFVQLFDGMMDTRNWLWGADHWTGLAWQIVKKGSRIVTIRDVLIDHISHHVKDLPQPESFKYFCEIMGRHPVIYNQTMVQEVATKINAHIDKLHEEQKMKSQNRDEENI